MESKEGADTTPDLKEIRLQENKQLLFENDARKMFPDGKAWFQLSIEGGESRKNSWNLREIKL